MSASEPQLRADGVALRFGCVAALSGVSFEVYERELFAIDVQLPERFLPPAGRKHSPARIELVRRRPAEIAALGVARTFQNLGLFVNLLDNLMLGRHGECCRIPI
jgi:branched-chain amino acid transport system ATP-binding protein